MDFSEKLENLKAKAAETAATVQAAAADDRDQLKQRIDPAQDAANQTMQDGKQQVEQAADRAESKWAQMKPMLLREEKTSRQRSRKGLSSEMPKQRPGTPIGPSWTHPMPSITRSTRSTTRNWLYWMRWTRVPMQTSAQRSPARKDPAARTAQDPWAADQSRHWRDGDAQTANVNCARVEKRRTADLATEQQTASRPEQDLTAEVKIKQLRQLFADAPEVGKRVLENVLQRFASDASKAPPLPVQSAGRGSGAGWAMSQTGLGRGALADLAFDEESHARRDTLQVFPRAGRYTVTAQRLSLHRNGVQYRIRKAEESLGGRIDDCRADPRACPASLPISWPCLYFGHWTPDWVGRAKHSIEPPSACAC